MILFMHFFTVIKKKKNTVPLVPLLLNITVTAVATVIILVVTALITVIVNVTVDIIIFC